MLLFIYKILTLHQSWFAVVNTNWHWISHGLLLFMTDTESVMVCCSLYRLALNQLMSVVVYTHQTDTESVMVCCNLLWLTLIQLMYVVVYTNWLWISHGVLQFIMTDTESDRVCCSLHRTDTASVMVCCSLYRLTLNQAWCAAIYDWHSWSAVVYTDVHWMLFVVVYTHQTDTESGMVCCNLLGLTLNHLRYVVVYPE